MGNTTHTNTAVTDRHPHSAPRRPRLQALSYCHMADIEYTFPLLLRFHGVHHSYNVETDSVEVVGISNCHDRSDTVP
jgi:hypothetical protein